MTGEPITRQALEAALVLWDGVSPRPVKPLSYQERFDLFESAARAILDAPPEKRCEVHDTPYFGEPGGPSECWFRWFLEDADPCQFATYVLVEVAP